MLKQIHNQQAIYGYLFAFITTAIWAGNFVVARSLNQSINPASLSFYRWLVAIIAILPFTLRRVIAERNIIRHLAFRDYLIHHRYRLKEYESLKKKLAKQFLYNIDKYCKGKELFIKRIEIETIRWFRNRLNSLKSKQF